MSNIEETQENLSESRVYEVGYLLVPTIPEENVSVAYGDMKELVHSLGGSVITDEIPKAMPLAYQMERVISNINHKFNNAYFGWVKFEMDPSALGSLKQKLEANKDLIRFLIIKTVRENTIATKRFAGKDVLRRKTMDKKEEGGEAAPINKEEIDKEIEALVGTE